MALGSGIRPLNAFYLELQRQLSSEDIAKIKDQLFNSHIDRADYDNLKTATQVFRYLEDRGYISNEDLTLLFELFRGIQRPNLVDQVRDFSENPLSPTSPLRSPLLPPSQRLTLKSLPLESLVQSSRLQRSPTLLVSQQQQLLPSFEGSVVPKWPRQDFGDQQVTKKRTRERRQEYGTLKAAKMMIPQPQFGKQSMLFVDSDWSNEVHRISILNRLLAGILESEAVDRYATTLEVSDTGFTVDDSGVTVVNALESKVDFLQNKTPTLDWLTNYPNAIYDHMKDIENIRLVVGHMSTGSDGHLHQAGLAIHENMKQSKFFLFNHSIPEGMSEVTPDVELAAKAEVVFSVGPTVYGHFQTQYRVPPAPKCHICFYPPTSSQFMGLNVNVPSKVSMQRILIFCEVKTTEDFKKYNEIAIAMGKVAEMFYCTLLSVPIWEVMVSARDLAGKLHEHLTKTSGSSQLKVNTIPSQSNQSLLEKLRQSVLLVVPEKRDPFNYVAYFAMQAGLPVVVAKHSGIGEFLGQLCPLIYDAHIVDDAGNWQQKIMLNLEKKEESFKRAKHLKEALANNDLIRTSTRTFVEYCRRVLRVKDISNIAGEDKDGKVPRTTEFEFRGPIGSLLMIVFLPLTIYYLYFACQPESCSVLYLQNVTFDLSDYLDRDAILIFIGWMLFQTLLYLAPIGTETEGVVLRNGTRLICKINAFYVVTISFAVFGLGVYYEYPLHVLYDKYLQLATTAVIFSFLLSLYLYIKAVMGPPSAIAPRGNSGYFVYDFFMGHELNPRIGKFDLKYFCKLRPGLIGWALLNFGMVLKMYERGEQPTAAILLVCFFQAMYVVDALCHEKSILIMTDIGQDGFGFMLVFGDLAWVPFTYSLQARYLVDHPVHLSNLAIAAIIGLKLAGFMIFRGSNSQKYAFRRNPNDPALKHLKSIPTRAGRSLLVSGWWGMVRNPNYLGEVLMAISWSLPCGFNSILPWFYPLYFIVLVIHRERRDSHECKKKYGQDWDNYCSQVKYRIVPYVY